MRDLGEQKKMVNSPGLDIEAGKGRVRLLTPSSIDPSLASYEKPTWCQRCRKWWSLAVHVSLVLLLGCCVWLIVTHIRMQKDIAALSHVYEQLSSPPLSEDLPIKVEDSPPVVKPSDGSDPGIPLQDMTLLALRRNSLQKMFAGGNKQYLKGMTFNSFQNVLYLTLPLNDKTNATEKPLNVLKTARFVEANGDVLGTNYEFTNGEITVKKSGVYLIFAQITFHQPRATNHAKICVDGKVVSHCMSSTGNHETCTLFTLRLISAGKTIDLTLGSSTGTAMIGVEEEEHGERESLSQLAVLRLSSA